MSRIVIVAGSRCGKSTLAAKLQRETGAQVYCGDPPDKAKECRPETIYLPEGLDIAGDHGAAAWVARHWFARPGPWICEGWSTARALKRWIDTVRGFEHQQDEWPCDRIIVITDHHPEAEVSDAQRAQHRGVMTTWRKIEHYFEEITEFHSHE